MGFCCAATTLPRGDADGEDPPPPAARFGEGALALLTELQHPSDNQIRGRDLSPHGNDKGHWFHQDMTFVTGKSREWIAQRVAVAIVNATYDAACAVAELCPRPDAAAFPPIHLGA